jgi:pimeloyl-ACP methyl ester carboxylesterase
VPCVNSGAGPRAAVGEEPATWPGALGRFGDAELFVRHTPPAGSGAEPAVAVHGLAGSATNWTDLATRLRDRLETYAPDLPGFGFSPPPPDRDLSVHGHTRAMVALAEDVVRRHGRPVHLLGNSLGGVVATLVAATRPDLVATLTLVSPALPHWRLRRTNWHLPLLAAPVVGPAVARRLARRGVPWRVRATIDLCFADPSRVSDDAVAAAIEEAIRRDGLDYAALVVRESLRGLLRTYVDPRAARAVWVAAARVQAPTLLVYGRRDRLVDPGTARRASGSFARSRLLTLPASGHVAMMENPDVVARAVRELVDAAGREQTGARIG